MDTNDARSAVELGIWYRTAATQKAQDASYNQVKNRAGSDIRMFQ
jgi:hypothetical protein